MQFQDFLSPITYKNLIIYYNFFYEYLVLFLVFINLHQLLKKHDQKLSYQTD